ncbi:hypothetical protein LJC55_04025 [Eubacteriales bacterium OttesenSCG-928-N14]|nr:hypothetical protein [Eubacteriales bacterium OttesenSCG-928-N14]
MEQVLMKLISIVNCYSPQHADYQIARFLLENFSDIASSSVEQMAERCFVSTTSLIRFAKNIGFPSYTQFRLVFENEAHLWEPCNHISGKYHRVETEEKTLQFIKNELDNSINNVHKEITAEMLAKITDLLNNAKDVYLIEDTELKHCTMDFQSRMLLAGRYIKYSKGWLSSSELHSGDVRIIPRFQQVMTQSSGCMSEIIITQKINKKTETINDIRIFIREQVPFHTTSQENLINGNHTALITLQYILQLIQSSFCVHKAMIKRNQL